MTSSTALVVSGIAQSIVALMQLYKNHSGKPAGWTPSESDWLVIEEWAARTPEDIKKDAAERLGVPWPPTEETPQAPV